eukprot:ctg_1132.g366
MQRRLEGWLGDCHSKTEYCCCGSDQQCLPHSFTKYTGAWPRLHRPPPHDHSCFILSRSRRRRALPILSPGVGAPWRTALVALPDTLRWCTALRSRSCVATTRDTPTAPRSSALGCTGQTVALAHHTASVPPFSRPPSYSSRLGASTPVRTRMNRSWAGDRIGHGDKHPATRGVTCRDPLPARDRTRSRASRCRLAGSSSRWHALARSPPSTFRILPVHFTRILHVRQCGIGARAGDTQTAGGTVADALGGGGRVGLARGPRQQAAQRRDTLSGTHCVAVV